MKIKGNTVGTTMPRSNWNQSDPSKADYIKGKDAVDEAISKAQSTADSAVTYARNAQYSADGKVGKTETTAILTSGKWADKKQTVNITGVTKKNAVIVGPSTDSHVAYCEAAVRYHEQGEGTITFICEDVPSADITLNVLILDEDATGGSAGSGSSGGSTDLTGYATEDWVRQGYQPKGEYLTKVPGGYATEEFVKNKIAEAALEGSEVDLSGYAQKSELPTKTSQLQNDSNFLTEHQDISGKLDADKLPEAVNAALEQANESGAFDGEDGATFTPALAEDGTLSWSNNMGLKNPDPVNIMGPKPARGTDYWTPADIAEIKSYVDEAILGGAW